MLDADLIRDNTDALRALEKRLQVVQQIMDEVVNEVGWIARNIADVPLTGEDLLRGMRAHEITRCMECERTIKGLGEALRQGWKELMLQEGTYMGLCVECSEGVDIACHGCQAIERMSGAEALRRGWTEVSDCEEGYAGLCPGCTADELNDSARRVAAVPETDTKHDTAIAGSEEDGTEARTERAEKERSKAAIGGPKAQTSLF